MKIKIFTIFNWSKLLRANYYTYLSILKQFWTAEAISLSQTQKYQNSYRMQPQNPFKIDLVEKIVKSVMNNRLDEIAYDNAEAIKLCGDIAAEIRRRVKKLNFDRCEINLHLGWFKDDIPREREIPRLIYKYMCITNFYENY